MPFVPKDWKDLPEQTTPLSAGAIEDIEVRVTNYTDARETAVRTDLVAGDNALDARLDTLEANTLDARLDVLEGQTLNTRLGVIEAQVPIPLVNALPGSPTDGQTCYFQNAAMATDGIIWKLRYRTSGVTYKWEYLGGAPLYARTSASETTNSTSYVDLATVGPSVTIPFAGTYDVSFILNISNSQTFAGALTTVVGPGITAGTVNDFSQVMANSLAYYVTQGRHRVTFTGSGAVKLQYKSNASSNDATFTARVIEVRPIKVG